MKPLINFIESKDVTKANIYKHLKCSKEEVELLQYVCQRYVQGLEEIPVLSMLQEQFSSENYTYLKKLVLVKNLLDLGWLIQMSFGLPAGLLTFLSDGL